ncbi:MAG: CoA pyrophosphatase [Acidimicrobiia bacterium]
MAITGCPWDGLNAAQRRVTVADVRECALRLPPAGVRPLRHDIPLERVRTAATLVPIVDLDGEAAVVVTKRPATMKFHRDDWVMPGGRVDTGVDIDSAAAARRELHEELGVNPQRVDIVGRLDSHGPIVTGFIIDVFIGIVATGTAIRRDPHEVAEALAIPLSRLTEPGCYYEDDQVPDHDTGPVATRAAVDTNTARMSTLRFFEIRPGELLWGTQGEILFELFTHLYAGRRAAG